MNDNLNLVINVVREMDSASDFIDEHGISDDDLNDFLDRPNDDVVAVTRRVWNSRIESFDDVVATALIAQRLGDDGGDFDDLEIAEQCLRKLVEAVLNWRDQRAQASAESCRTQGE